MRQLMRLKEDLRRLDPFSLTVISFGLRVACGLYALCYLFYFTAGHIGNLEETLNCLSGALDAAPAVVVVSIFAALLCDLEIKYRNRDNS